MLFLALFHPESESDFFAIFFVLSRKWEWFFKTFLFLATMPFLALPHPERICTSSWRSPLHHQIPAILSTSCFCHQPRNHRHHQGSGVELELGDSTSLEWEEEFVLAAQRSFRCLQKVSLHLNNQVIKWRCRDPPQCSEELWSNKWKGNCHFGELVFLQLLCEIFVS